MCMTLKSLATTPERPLPINQWSIRRITLLTHSRDMSSDIQSLRQTAEQRIVSSVENINAILQRIDTLNTKVSSFAGNDADANIKDQRVVELQKLSSEMDIQYFLYQSECPVDLPRIQDKLYFIPTTPKLSLHCDEYVNGGTLYPCLGFSAIDLDGVDITTSIPWRKSWRLY